MALTAPGIGFCGFSSCGLSGCSGSVDSSGDSGCPGSVGFSATSGCSGFSVSSGVSSDAPDCSIPCSYSVSAERIICSA